MYFISTLFEPSVTHTQRGVHQYIFLLKQNMISRDG